MKLSVENRVENHELLAERFVFFQRQIKGRTVVLYASEESKVKGAFIENDGIKQAWFVKGIPADQIFAPDLYQPLKEFITDECYVTTQFDEITINASLNGGAWGAKRVAGVVGGAGAAVAGLTLGIAFAPVAVPGMIAVGVVTSAVTGAGAQTAIYSATTDEEDITLKEVAKQSAVGGIAGGVTGGFGMIGASGTLAKAVVQAGSAGTSKAASSVADDVLHGRDINLSATDVLVSMAAGGAASLGADLGGGAAKKVFNKASGKSMSTGSGAASKAAEKVAKSASSSSEAAKTEAVKKAAKLTGKKLAKRTAKRVGGAVGGATGAGAAKVATNKFEGKSGGDELGKEVAKGAALGAIIGGAKYKADAKVVQYVEENKGAMCTGAAIAIVASSVFKSQEKTNDAPPTDDAPPNDGLRRTEEEANKDEGEGHNLTKTPSDGVENSVSSGGNPPSEGVFSETDQEPDGGTQTTESSETSGVPANQETTSRRPHFLGNIANISVPPTEAEVEDEDEENAAGTTMTRS